jgi:hypothetical protein
MHNSIDLSEIGFHATTFSGAGLTASMSGKAVTIVGPGVVGLGTTGHVLLGKIISSNPNGDTYGIQDRGYCELPAGTKIPERTNVTVNGSGSVVAGSEVALPMVVDNSKYAADGTVCIFLG